jgi:CBS domain containing-hemolysin-like protein
MELLIASIVVSFCTSFLCSLSEASLLSLTPGQLADIERTRPRIGSILRQFKQNIRRPIAVILLLNTSAATIGATVAGSQFSIVMGHEWIAAFSIGFTFLIFQFTEILPKTLGVQFSSQIAPKVARPLQILVSVLSPLIRVIHLINSPFEAGLRKASGRPPAEVLNEITALAGAAKIDNLIGQHQERIITMSTRLSRLPARDVMVPIDQVTFLSSTHTLADALIAAHTDPHTRFPIIEGDNRNKVLGYVNFKELVYRVRTNPADPTLRGIVRPIYFLPPDMTCNQILRIFVDEHVHIALVRNEPDGQIMGLLTLEDVVEELVGEIEDEFDKLPKMLQALSGGVWIVGGGVPVADMTAKIGIEVEATKDILSAWLIRHFQCIPRLGQVITIADRDFTVRRMRRGKLFEVLVTPKGLAPREFM